MPHIRDHIVHYLIILAILVLGFGLTNVFSESRSMQLFSVLFVASLYLGYGIVHHRLEHDLTVKIVVEYVLITLLAMVLFIFVSQGL